MDFMQVAVTIIFALVGVVWGMLSSRITRIEKDHASAMAKIDSMHEKIFDLLRQIQADVHKISVEAEREKQDCLQTFMLKSDCRERHPIKK